MSENDHSDSALTPEQIELANFYDVDTKDALIDAQAKHIEKLQDQLPRTGDWPTGRVREG